MTCIIVDCLTYEVRISINWYVDSLINNVFTEVTDKYTPAYIRDVTNNHSNYFLTIKFHLKVVITRGRSLVDGIPHVIVERMGVKICIYFQSNCALYHWGYFKLI